MVDLPGGGSFWFLSGDPGPVRPPLVGRVRADVAVVGGGFTGLWSAIRLLETAPALRVVVLEAERVGLGGRGRHGCFCAASLTHGLHNGLLHFEDELEILEAEGVRNLRELVAFIRNEGIDAELEETGTLDVATEPWQVEGLEEYVELAGAHGIGLQLLERDEIQDVVHSPTFRAAVRGG